MYVYGGKEKLIYKAQPKCAKIRAASVLDYYHRLETVSPHSVRIMFILLLYSMSRRGLSGMLVRYSIRCPKIYLI